jgi:hypothetical protein
MQGVRPDMGRSKQESDHKGLLDFLPGGNEKLLFRARSSIQAAQEVEMVQDPISVSWRWWYAPVIPDTCKAIGRKILPRLALGKNLRPYLKTN